jgi:hypothetical protein
LSQQFGEGEDGERRLSHGEGRPPKKKSSWRLMQD